MLSSFTSNSNPRRVYLEKAAILQIQSYIEYWFRGLGTIGELHSDYLLINICLPFYFELLFLDSAAFLVIMSKREHLASQSSNSNVVGPNIYLVDSQPAAQVNRYYGC